MRHGFAGLALIFMLAGSAWGQPEQSSGRTGDRERLSQTAAPPPEDTGPVTVPEPSALAMRYYFTGNVLWIVREIWALAVPGLILFTGLSATIRNAAVRVGRWWLPTIILYFIAYALLTYLIDWPFNFYEGFLRQHAYGLSNQTLGKWLGDSLKGLLVTLVAGCLFLWVPYLLLRLSPRRWWLYTGILSIPFGFFVALVTPIWVEPLFNDFHEMKDKSLEAKILALAHRAGIEEDKVYEVEKSKDTKAVNAYATGFLGTKRIVLWDTLLQKMDEREVVVVMGHEMGHYVLNHIVQGILLASLPILVGLYAVHFLSGILIRRYKDRFGFDRLADIASFPLLLLLGLGVSFVLTPVGLAFSRHVEHEADRFGLEITKDNHAAATAFVKLQQENLSNPWPGPVIKLLRASHPPLGERVEFANNYWPWKKGEPLRYGEYFTSK
jgi:Zn-dependent protease with chaperone function